MRKALIPFVLPTALLFAVACQTNGDGKGDLSKCGQIDISAKADCKLEIMGGCTAKCQPVNFTASCAGKCNVDIDAACKADCTGGCKTKCDLDPGKLDCKAECGLHCEGGCTTKCKADPNSAKCKASCDATCASECGGSCTGTPPSADCTAKCDASCSGSCKVKANIDCSVNCQADLQGGCEVECSKPEGALFCDNQFVDHGGNLQDCIAALNGYLEVEVDASASAACSNGTCKAEAEAGIKCAIANPGTPTNGSPWYVFVAGALGIGLASRRRRA